MAPGRGPEQGESEVPGRSIRVVGIGVAAGGVEPLAAVFGRLPADTGMAYVVLPGPEWSEARGIAAALQYHSPIHVRHVSDLTTLESDRVYVVPPGGQATISNHTIGLRARTRQSVGGFDAFLLSLARDKGRDAIALVLSGAGTDGARGVRAIKRAGGLTVAQDPDTAAYREMPSAAIETGMVDLVLPAEAIVHRLAWRGRRVDQPALLAESNDLDDETAEILARIIAEVRRRGGHDFSVYAPQALLQRVASRMKATAHGSLLDYLGSIQADPDEAAALSGELGSGTLSILGERRAGSRRLLRLEREVEDLKRRLPSTGGRPKRAARASAPRPIGPDAPPREIDALLAATEGVTLLLDRDLRVIASTPGAAALFGLGEPSELRDLPAIARALGDKGLERDARKVMRTGSEVEHEIRGAEGRDYLLRLRARRSAQRGIEGAALTMVDVTRLRAAADDSLRAAVNALAEQLEERVEESADQVVALRSALTHAEQNERQRISKLLHDDLQQMLYSLELTCQQILRRRTNKEDDADLLERMTSVISRAIDATRALSIELSPPILSRQGLVESLRWLGHHLESTFGLPVDVKGQTGLHIQNLDLRVLLFHVVRELLFNTIKHADATSAEVHVSSEGDRVVVRVADDGFGFDPSVIDPTGTHPGPGQGIVGVRERLRLFGGRMEVDSKPGRGARFTLSVPNLEGLNNEGEATVKPEPAPQPRL